MKTDKSDAVSVLNHRVAHRGRNFSFVVDEIVLPNGHRSQAAYVAHPGSTAVVPLYEDGTIALTRQYRHPLRTEILEIPAGTNEPGESPLTCAKRELEEETGLIADSWQELSTVHILPSYSDELIHVFLATKLTQSQQRLDADEIIDVVRVSLENVYQMLSDGEITDALTIMALQQLKLQTR